MIAQLTTVQCQVSPQSPGLSPLGGDLALNRLPGLASPLDMSGSALLQQSLQTGQVLLQMMSLLLGLMAAGGAGSALAGGSQTGGTQELGQASSSGGSGGGGGTSSVTGGGGNVDPSTVTDKDKGGGLSANAQRGLEEAHKWGLPLVSGKRSGNGKSDHDHGDAIDVGTLPIGAASSNGGTQQMKDFAEHMRLEGKAGRLNVKYIIRDGQIASSKGNWEWRPYTYPGKSQAELDALKRSNPGEYNRLQHFDHVHVSFN